MDGETRKNSCGTDVLRKRKISGNTHKNVKLRKFHSLTDIAIKAKEITRLRFGSDIHVRVRKKISIKAVAFFVISLNVFGGLR